MAQVIKALMDLSVIEQEVRIKYPKRSLDYQSLLSRLKDADEVDGIAYGCYLRDGSMALERALQAYGWQTRFKPPRPSGDRCYWAVGIAVDALSCDADTIVLIGCGHEQEPLIRELKFRNVDVEVIGCSVPNVIKLCAKEVTEVNEEMLLALARQA